MSYKDFITQDYNTICVGSGKQAIDLRTKDSSKRIRSSYSFTYWNRNKTIPNGPEPPKNLFELPITGIFVSEEQQHGREKLANEDETKPEIARADEYETLAKMCLEKKQWVQTLCKNTCKRGWIRHALTGLLSCHTRLCYTVSQGNMQVT